LVLQAIGRPWLGLKTLLVDRPAIDNTQPERPIVDTNEGGTDLHKEFTVRFRKCEVLVFQFVEDSVLAEVRNVISACGAGLRGIAATFPKKLGFDVLEPPSEMFEIHATSSGARQHESDHRRTREPEDSRTIMKRYARNIRIANGSMSERLALFVNNCVVSGASASLPKETA
jgi:hypothetical protein